MLRPLVVAALALLAGPAPAAVVAVYNSSDRAVTFAVSHASGPAARHTLQSGESKLVPVGRLPDISFQAGPQAVKFRLEPYHAYLFSAEKGPTEFHGVELAGAMPRPDDVPADPPPGDPLPLPVLLLADDSNPRTRAGWEKVYRERLAAASEVLAKQCGVALRISEVADWRSDRTTSDLFAQLKRFEGAVKPPAGSVAVGFTSRLPPAGDKAEFATGAARGPLWPYLLVRDGQLRTEPERVEAVVREFGHYLGSAHSPDPLSAVRAKPADGRGLAGRFPIGLDPVNLLAVGIWVEELRAGKPRSVADLRPMSRDRLAVVYKTLSAILPTDELAAEHLAELERVGQAAIAKADPPPVPEAPKPEPTAVMPVPKPAEPPAVVKEPPPEPVKPAKADRTEAVRRVVQAVRLRAIDLKRDPDAAGKRAGDALSAELLRTAAELAYGMDGSVRVGAFVIGIGIALDDSDVLRNNPVVGTIVKAAESDAERAERLAALGTPTLRGRRDLLQHFVVSAALCELIGQPAAESVGLLKELRDRDGVSGFSFADLQADYAGVALGVTLKKFPEGLGWFLNGGDLREFMPPLDTLREGLTAAKFGEQFGDKPDDPRLVAELARVKKRVTDLGKHRDVANLK